MFAPRIQPGIVFYDGVCALCNGWVRFVLKRTAPGTISFAPLQGETARQRASIPGEVRTVVLVLHPGEAQERVLLRSSAALELLNQIGGVWRMVSWLRIVPRCVRDWVYDFIAVRRYQWFGNYDTCPAPLPEWRNRFLP